MDYQKVLETIYQTIRQQQPTGTVAAYIPELAKVNPDQFGVHLTTIQQEKYGVGDFQKRFSIQSISKVLSLCLAYQLHGTEIWNRVGVEPSGTPFNSLVQLEYDLGIPRNPFMNGGALVICDILLSTFPDAKNAVLDFIRDLADNPNLNYAPAIVASERSTGNRNQALCHFIKSFNNIHNNPEDVLDLYFHLCSIEMSCEELSRTFLFFANNGCKVTDGKEILNPSRNKRLNALMLTCGFYDESGDFAFKVGLPGKSGVGGGILAIHPGKYSIAVWSPRLNTKGNSQRGMDFLELFTTRTASSIF
jgi:glutaminase